MPYRWAASAVLRAELDGREAALAPRVILLSTIVGTAIILLSAYLFTGLFTG